jgi:hypothetical protein
MSTDGTRDRFIAHRPRLPANPSLLDPHQCSRRESRLSPRSRQTYGRSRREGAA